MQSKICKKCKIEKSVDQFPRRTPSKDGFRGECKDCLKQYHKLYVQINSKKLSEKCHNYYKVNKKQLLAQKKTYHLAHKKQRSNYMKKYYKEHKEERQVYNKLFRKTHREYLNQYRQNEYKTNIDFRLGLNIRNRINQALRRNSKFSSTIKLLGCSIEFLKKYLEFKFERNMSWNNYGEWQVDHIIPCASFDLSKESEQNKCFNYTNLQPLWLKDNMSKGAHCEKIHQIS